jgi:hypothetical protein
MSTPAQNPNNLQTLKPETSNAQTSTDTDTIPNTTRDIPPIICAGSKHKLELDTDTNTHYTPQPSTPIERAGSELLG